LLDGIPETSALSAQTEEVFRRSEYDALKDGRGAPQSDLFVEPANSDASTHQHLTKRDQFANPLEDLFDFDAAPSLGITLTQAAPPTVDCTPK
jgi:hypothetical protein